MFEIKSDLEFYCYLKFHLPSDFSIVSEPQTSYYSEWYFNYRVYYKNKFMKNLGINTINMIETLAKKQMIDLGYDLYTDADWKYPLFFKTKELINDKISALRNKNNNKSDIHLLFSKLELIQEIHKNSVNRYNSHSQ